ncbi:MAG TPA: hypothetical protein VGQ13_09305 [Nitrososphaera sp.]|jgi:hypothetical protein|nr:hypothetical protein [Nitrososphaera sp.]
MVNTTHYTLFAQELNHLIDAGNTNFDIGYIKNLMDKGVDIFELIEKRGDKHLDLSIFDAATRKEINQTLTDLISLNERRKFGIEKNGLCLILACVIEAIQIRVRKLE